MIEALNFTRLQEEVRDRYEYNEQCIVGIIFARYDLQHVPVSYTHLSETVRTLMGRDGILYVSIFQKIRIVYLTPNV